MTTRRLVFTTFAVRRIVITTGSDPQANVITPPFATARTTFFEVQLAGVPLPITRSGWLVSTARAAFGTGTCFTPRTTPRSAVRSALAAVTPGCARGVGAAYAGRADAVAA